MIKGAIFDVDGTLLDSMPTWHDLGSRYLRRLGLDAEPGLNEKLFTLSFEEGAAYMRERYHLPQDPAEIIQEILHMIADFYAEEVDFKPGMQSLLDFLTQLDTTALKEKFVKRKILNLCEILEDENQLFVGIFDRLLNQFQSYEKHLLLAYEFFFKRD